MLLVEEECAIKTFKWYFALQWLFKTFLIISFLIFLVFIIQYFFKYPLLWGNHRYNIFYNTSILITIIHSFSAIYLLTWPTFFSSIFALSFRHAPVMYIATCIYNICYRDLIMLHFFSYVSSIECVFLGGKGLKIRTFAICL